MTQHRLRRSQVLLLNWIIQFTREHHCPPMQVHVTAGTKISNPWQSLKILERRGYIHQPVKGGPWVALHTPDGQRLQPLAHDWVESPRGD